MCDIVKRCGKKQATGYKVAVQVGNRFYSIHSGIQYKVGPIPVMNKIELYEKKEKSIYAVKGISWESLMVGRTGVLINKPCADVLCKTLKGKDSFKFVILEMTITGNMYYAQMGVWNTIIGKEIVSIKKVK